MDERRYAQSKPLWTLKGVLNVATSIEDELPRDDSSTDSKEYDDSKSRDKSSRKSKRDKMSYKEKHSHQSNEETKKDQVVRVTLMPGHW